MKRAPVVHPFLFAVSPILFLLKHNMHLFDVSVILGPVAATTCVALVSWSVLSLALRDKKKAGLILSLFFLLFFSYESSCDVIQDFMRGLGVSRVWMQRYLLLTWAILFAVAAGFMIRTRRSLRNLTNISNIVAGALVVLSLVSIAAQKVNTRSPWLEAGSAERMEANPSDLLEADTLPSIYYIIFDGYARADVLEEVYQYDNTEFLDSLKRRGFFVADRGRSNYMQTTLSLAASLNFEYLDDVALRQDIESSDRAPLVRMIWNNRVSRFLKNYGYATVAFSSGWFGTEIRGADMYLAPRWHPDEFQSQLIGMTPVPFIVKQLGGPDGYDLHRERILYALDGVVEVSELEGPIFVFAHIISPHPPFVFGRHGEEMQPDYQFALSDGSHVITKRKLTREEYLEGYREQLIFINRKIEEMVDGILARSVRPAIIILQADTGPGSLLDYEDPDNTYLKERLCILNAYHLPGNGDIPLYEAITPVNTFRVILNHYFGTDYELLEDESYFAPYSRPYAFTNVTDEMNDDVGMERPE